MTNLINDLLQALNQAKVCIDFTPNIYAEDDYRSYPLDYTISFIKREFFDLLNFDVINADFFKEHADILSQYDIYYNQSANHGIVFIDGGEGYIINGSATAFAINAHIKEVGGKCSIYMRHCTVDVMRGLPEISGIYYTVAKLRTDVRYSANFSANNNESLREPITSSNRKEIIRYIRDYAEGYRYDHNSCKWWVHDYLGRLVASGGMWSNGKRYRDYN